MKLRDLITQLHELEARHPDIPVMDFDVYLEQITEQDKIYKRGEQEWEYYKSQGDFDDWEYFKVHGFNTIIPHKRIVTININY